MQIHRNSPWLAAAASLAFQAAVFAAPVDAPAPPLPSGTPLPPAGELDDPVAPLEPLAKRTSREDDRIRALAFFAAGRVAEQKQDYVRALRNYERAYRYNPSAVAPLREIVPLAFNLDRQTEGVRYALMMAEREPTDPVLLERLAGYLTEEGDLARALKMCETAATLYQKNVPKPGEEPRPKAAQVPLWMELGRLYFLTKKYDQSAQYFGQVYQALENPAEFGLDARAQKALLNKAELAYQLFGESFLEGGKPEQALAAFDKANQIKPDEALSLFNRARVEAKQKQPAQALAKLETYLDKHFATQGTAPYTLLSTVLTDLGQKDQFLPRLEKARADDVDNLPLSFFLAQQFSQTDQLDKAAQTFGDLLERRKARPPLEAIQGLIEVRRKQKDAPRLLDILGDGAGRIGNLSQLGESVKDLVADTELTKAVLAEARRRLDADQDKVTYGERLAAALLAVEIKDFATAGTFFELAAKANPAKASEVYVTWGLELFVANQYAETIAVFRRGLDEKILADDNATLHYYLAGALEMNGRTDEALVEARRAAELQKDSPRLHSRVAWIEYHAKRFDAARQSYEALLDRFDKEHDSPEVREVMRDARLVLSNIAVQQGKLPESEEWLEQVLDEFPEDVGAQNDLGYLWADGGKHLDLALAMIQFAVSRDAKNTAYRDSLGWVLFRLGRYGEAVAELKAATASSEEPDGTILDHLAEALLKSGDKPAAIEAWQRAAQQFDKHEEPDKAKAARDKIAAAEAAEPEKK